MVFEDKYMRKTSNSESLIKKALTQYVMTVWIIYLDYKITCILFEVTYNVKSSLKF